MGVIPWRFWWRRTRRRRRRTSNAYAGFRLRTGQKIPSISILNTDARQFFDRFVRTRTPVLIRGMLPELVAPCQRWCSGGLRSAAGHCKVEVEQRGSSSEAFGRGKKTTMPFGRMLDLMEHHDPCHYMTTQQLPTLADGREGLMADPLSLVRHDVPLRPSLLPNLYPQSINLWCGYADEKGASSGLHHDFHDNLYCLLRGQKRIRLYSPRDATRLYTRGSIEHVHPNGRINYRGAPTFADGMTTEDARAHSLRKARRAHRAAERMLQAAEASEAAGEEGISDRLTEAEEALDAAADRLALIRMQRGPRRRPSHAVEAAAADPEPPNFSIIESSLPEATVAERFPRRRRARSTTCQVNAGDMLYMPCGWFHDVTSYGEHMALNFWFHPPDRPEFDQPYSHASFWEGEWRRQARDTGQQG